MVSAGGQKSTASSGEGLEGGGVVVQEVDDRVGEFGSKICERHGASGVGRPEGKILRRSNLERLYSNPSA